MSVQRDSEIPISEGNEGTQIKQYFHPHNTLNGIRFSLAQFSIRPNKRSLCHKLRSSEVYYVLEGEGILTINDEKIRIQKDDSVYVPPHSEQFVENTGSGDLKFLCIVDPAWKARDETVLE